MYEKINKLTQEKADVEKQLPLFEQENADLKKKN